MAPAQPPPPTTSSLPFQFSIGSQTSDSMCESEDGFSTATIRQCAASEIGCGAGGPPRPRPAGWPAGWATAAGVGAVYRPVGTVSAIVMVTSGRLIDLRLSHDGRLLAPLTSVPARRNAIIKPPIVGRGFQPRHRGPERAALRRDLPTAVRKQTARTRRQSPHTVYRPRQTTREYLGCWRRAACPTAACPCRRRAR